MARKAGWCNGACHNPLTVLCHILVLKDTQPSTIMLYQTYVLFICTDCSSSMLNSKIFFFFFETMQVSIELAC